MPRSLRVLFDNALVGNPAGTGTFVRGVQAALARQEGLTLVPAGSAGRPHQLDIGTKGPARRLRNAVDRIWYYLQVLPARARLARCDVIYCPAAVTPLRGGPPAVMTVFDLSVRRYPQTFDPMSRIYAQQMLRIGLHRCPALCTISESVKAELLTDDRRLTDERIAVAYPGPGPELLDATPEQALSQEQNYLLMVGTLEPRKNHLTAVRAFADHRQRHRDSTLRLVLAGSPGWRYRRVLDEITRLDLQDAVIRLGPTPPARLRWLYLHARALLFPSLYEGFGLPVLEAFALQCPVIAARIPPVLEIASADAATLLDPLDVPAWSEAITQAACEAPDGARIQAASERAARFSWDACASAVLDALRLAVV